MTESPEPDVGNEDDGADDEEAGPFWPLGEPMVHASLPRMAAPTYDPPCEELDMLEALWQEGQLLLAGSAEGELLDRCQEAIDQLSGSDAWTAESLAEPVRQVARYFLIRSGIGVGTEPPTRARLAKRYGNTPLVLHRLAALLEAFGAESMSAAYELRGYHSVAKVLDHWWVFMIAACVRIERDDDGTMGHINLPLMQTNGPNTRLATDASYAHLTWVEWLTLTNPELIQLGVPKDYVTESRRLVIGHDRHMSAKWAPSVGMWGGVASPQEIQETTGASPSNLRSYAKAMGLTGASRNTPQRSQAKVAWLERDGLLPVEEFLYASERAAALKHLPEDEDGNVAWTVFRDAWDDRNILIGLPPD